MNDFVITPGEPPTGLNSGPNSGGLDTAKVALRSLMTDRGIPSLVALSVKAQVSIGAVKRLQSGNLAAMQIQTVAKLAQALNVSIEDLMRLGESGTAPPPPILSFGLQQEYDRLLQQFNQQETHLQERFQRDALQTLEPWLLQWSAAAYAAQTNSQLTAIKLLPLLRPIEMLLAQWAVTAIGAVGEELAYDPTVHQPMNSEDLAAGTTVRIRFSGYGYQGQVLHRAKVVRV
jgi:DNA-binding Xre family transcriptional regulator